MPSVDPANGECPYQVIQFCSLCHKDGGQGQKSVTAGDRCQSGRHQFELNKMFLILPSKKRLDKMPYSSLSRSGGKMCSYVERLGKCTGASCTFAHSKEELEIWAWMKKHGGMEPLGFK